MDYTEKLTSLDDYILPQSDLKCNSVDYTIKKAERIKRKTKNISKAIALKYQSVDRNHKAEDVKNCGSFLMFKEHKDIDRTTFLHRANFCKHPVCPLCAWRKSLRDFGILDTAIKLIKKDFHRVNIYHLVLAVPNVSKITKSDLSELKRKAVYFIKNYIGTENYYTSLEITYSADTGFHPHLHCLLATDDFIKVSEDYVYNMAMLWKKVYDKSDSKYRSYTFYVTGLKGEKGLHEMTKYILKVQKLDELEACILHTDFIFEMKGVRKNSSGGLFKEYLPKAKKLIKQDFEQTKFKMADIDYIYRIFEYIQSAEKYTEKS